MEMMTFSGIFMDPLHPEEEDLHLEDIAHALSMISRANGHFPEVHTVAQHCMECWAEAKARKLSEEIQMFCLLHDGAEAYLGDFIHPVKENAGLCFRRGKAAADDLSKIYRTSSG